jgi:hypothetical protein
LPVWLNHNFGKKENEKKTPCLNQVGEVVLSSSAIILSYM